YVAGCGSRSRIPMHCETSSPDWQRPGGGRFIVPEVVCKPRARWRAKERGNMNRLVLAYVFVAVMAVSSVASGQWLRYPTEGFPITPDGPLVLPAPAPRLPDGHLDFSGVWHAAQSRQCANAAGEAVPCGTEIGGSPLGGNLGRNLPAGTLPYQPWAAKLF